MTAERSNTGQLSSSPRARRSEFLWKEVTKSRADLAD